MEKTKVRLVFDPILWGGKDVGDNSQFWKPAIIVREYREDGYGDWLADVEWPDGTRSHGHFVHAMKAYAPKRCTTCQGKTRETVDMVCQDCGRDYNLVHPYPTKGF